VQAHVGPHRVLALAGIGGLAQQRPGLPPELDRIVLRALAKSRDIDRPRNLAKSVTVE